MTIILNLLNSTDFYPDLVTDNSSAHFCAYYAGKKAKFTALFGMFPKFSVQLSGYFGTQNFNVVLIAPYMLYLIANVAFRIWFNVTSEEAIGFIVLNTLGIILEVYIAFIVARFIFTVYRISAQDRDQLRNLERIR